MSFNKSLYVEPLALQSNIVELQVDYRLENEHQLPFGMLHNNFPYVLKINKRNWSCVSHYVYVNLFEYVTNQIKTENIIEAQKNISTCAIPNIYRVYNTELKKIYDEQTVQCINEAFQAKVMYNDEIIEFLLFESGANQIIYESDNEFLSAFYGQLLTNFRDFQKENWLNKQYYKAYIVIHILQQYLLTEDSLEQIMGIERMFLKQPYTTEEVTSKLFDQIINNFGIENVKKLNISHITLNTNKTLLHVCELSVNNPIILSYYAYSTHLELCKYRMDNKKMDIIFHEYIKFKFLDKKSNKITTSLELNTDSLLENINQQLKSVNYDRLKGEIYKLYKNNKIKSVNKTLHELIENRVKDLMEISNEDIKLYKNFDFEKKYYQFTQNHQSYVSLLNRTTHAYVFNDENTPLLSFTDKSKPFRINDVQYDSIKEYVDSRLESIFSILNDKKEYNNVKKLLCQIALDKKFGISNNKNISIKPVSYFEEDLESLNRKDEIEYSRRVYDIQLVLALSTGLNIVYVDNDDVFNHRNENFVGKYISMNNKYFVKNLNYFGNAYVKSKFELRKFIETDIYMIEWMKIHLKYILNLLGNISKYMQNITADENQIHLSEDKLVNIFKIISESNMFTEKVRYRYNIEITTDFAKQVSDLTDNFRDLFIVDEKVFLTLLTEYLQHNISQMAEIYDGDEIKIKSALTKLSLLLSQTKKCISNTSNNFYACCLLSILNVENKLDQIKELMMQKTKEELESSSSSDTDDIFMDGSNKNDNLIIVSIILNIPYKAIVKIAEKSELVDVEEVIEEEDEEEKDEYDYPEEEESQEIELDGVSNNIQKEIKEILDENPSYKEKTKFSIVEISQMISMIKKSPLPFHIKQARINMFQKIDI